MSTRPPRAWAGQRSAREAMRGFHSPRRARSDLGSRFSLMISLSAMCHPGPGMALNTHRGKSAGSFSKVGVFLQGQLGERCHACPVIRSATSSTAPRSVSSVTTSPFLRTVQR
jgi:hypothetical protein